MKKRILTLFTSLCSFFLLCSCGVVKGFEQDISISVRVTGELYYSGTVNIFNNVILPKMDASYVPTNMKFAGYTLDSGWTIDDGVDKLYKEGAIIRYNDIKQYSYNGNVELFSQFVGKDVDIAEKHYLAVGWYNKLKTSGIDEKIAGKIEENLKTFLVANGATKEDLADFIFKGYEGDVGTSGGRINDDGYMDVVIGWGANLQSTGGVNYIDRYAAKENYGEATKRYVYLLRDKPVSRLVYEYFDTDEFYAVFK